MKTFQEIRKSELTEAPIDPKKVFDKTYKDYRDILRIIKDAEASIQKKINSIQDQLYSAEDYFDPGTPLTALEQMPDVITAMKEVVKNQRMYETKYFNTIFDSIKK